MTATLDAEVLAAQSGDREAFTRLVDAYRNVVCSIVTAVTRDLEASEDVAQEVFLAAWQGLGKLRNPASFLPWLRQLARNQAHFSARTRGRRLRRQPLAVDDDLLARAVDPSPTPSERLVDAEQLEQLVDALSRLPDDAREVVTLYYREGRSARQVGELLGLREDAVKKRLERARAVLRRELLEHVGEVLERTAPGAAFTAAVVLVVAAPGTAGAATTALVGGASVAGWLSKSGWLGKLAIASSGFGLGLFGGIAGVLFGLRDRLRRAADDRERRELRRLAIASGLVVFLVVLGIQVSAMLGSAELLLGVWLAALPVHGWIYLRWLPRIVSRRRARERAEDPDAVALQRRERRRSALGFWFGVTVGSAVVVWAAITLAQGQPP